MKLGTMLELNQEEIPAKEGGCSIFINRVREVVIEFTLCERIFFLLHKKRQ